MADIQVFYVRPREDRSWAVSRVGRPVAIFTSERDAIDLGRRIAWRAAQRGVPAELRVAREGRHYEIEGRFTPAGLT